jgi:NADPH-dependent 2,4-dienoyl-CoA reductase/sulfur reductase-like enzyme/ferredoxin
LPGQLDYILLGALVRATSNKITVLYGALALNLYYWFNAPMLGSLLGTPPPDWFVWPLRTLVLGLTLFWIYRTYRKEPAFVTQMVAASSIVSASNIVLTMPRPSQIVASSSKPVVSIEPEGKRIVVEKNRTLLEIIESNNLPIEAGCRMGLCGADPVCIHAGMDKLSKIGDAERATLERLALAPNTRMACMARVRGDVSLGLKPERPQLYVSSVVAGFKYDKAVQKVVIVGNGIAGATAADHIRRRHPHCEIHLIGRERHHLYNRMGITRLIYGRSAMQGLYLLPDKWYDDFNITCWLNTHVTQIDGQTRQVTLGTGETLAYDRLILTTGSQSYVPPFAGHDLSGVFVLRTAEDAMAIRAFVQEQGCRHAVIAGGGLLGLEAAYGLHKLGLEVTVLERSNSLLRRQLDARGGQFLCEYLTNMGIQIVMQAEVTAVQDGTPPVQRVQEVLLNNGSTLPCDLLLVAAGIRADLELARGLGLTVNQGVVVDAEMRTSNPLVFAAGDVAEYEGKLYGLWPVAVSQAEVAANNAVAAPGALASTYEEAPPVTMLKVVGIDLTSVGRIEPLGDGETVIALEESAQHRYRKLILSQGKIVGAILLGYPLEAPGVTAAVREQTDVTPHIAALQTGDWEALQALA